MIFLKVGFEGMVLSRQLRGIRKNIEFLYPDKASDVFKKLQELLNVYKDHQIILEKKKQYKDRSVFSHKDVFLIAYADSIVSDDEKPLKTLKRFLDTYVQDSFSGIHLLPFFPSSSDGGFSVIDFRMVDDRLGSWEDISHIGQNYRIVADLVLNHISVKSEWFQQFLAGNKKYQDYFLSYERDFDTSKVFRPRVHSLLTPFTMANGDKKYVWTTFSEDQVDLNFQSPDVFLEIVDIMLFYFSKGVEGIRLDAVAFLWKSLDSSSIHLPETHAIVKILRSIIEEVVPYGFLISETNVPYAENISYFGNGEDEVHLVYGFDLPPLVVHAFLHENAHRIKQFCAGAECEENILFFHFAASHDGVGLLGAESILSKNEVEQVGQSMLERGGYISYKALPGEPHKPYEINISFFDAINRTFEESYEANARFVASQIFMMCLKGVPGMYIHSFLASRNNSEEARETGIKRLINRKKLSWPVLTMALEESVSRRAQVLRELKKHLACRMSLRALSPYASQHILRQDSRLFIVERSFEGESVTVVINVSQESVDLPDYKDCFDVYSQTSFSGTVASYQVLYLIKS